MNIYSIIIVILILLNFLFLIIGYILGRLHSQNSVGSQQKSFFDDNKTITSHQNKINTISIDDTKYVTSIDIGNIEKKFDTLGETKNSEEQIESSINKLKNLKR